MQGDSYGIAPEVLRDFLDVLVLGIVDSCERTDVKLVSTPLHGSLTMGSFYLPKVTATFSLLLMTCPNLRTTHLRPLQAPSR